eukprot:TRINITY_DN35799_c0_g1_i1.p1 TRINITY_DN35799_c0_g1~~TRINITY_DN35799_c0_g1_i1.p1  ORF type:complete len:504 (+),score=64.73 TRINITY_DN35799_c0_g1_i1:69-1514(+)
MAASSGVLIPLLCHLALMVHAQIRIMAPESLVSEFRSQRARIEGSTATFGAPFYGERILGRLVYGKSAGNNHCSEDDYDVPLPSEFQPSGRKYKEVRLIHIVLVERGTCSFVTKVKVARKKKAHAVVIVDRKNSSMTPHNIKRIIVADDGYGSTVNIPSILISRQEGQKLIDTLQHSQVIVELAWDVPSNSVVVVDLWMNSASKESARFLKEFEPKRVALNEYIRFVPHFAIFSMQAEQDYNELCTDASARFCAEDPDSSGDVTGRMVIDEDVRRLCIHDVTKVKMKNRVPIGTSPVNVPEYAAGFWEYLKRFPDECPLDGTDPQRKFGRTCSERVMQMGGVDVDLAKVRDCVLDTKDDKLLAQRKNVAWSPRALRINGWRYSGSMDADLVTRAICAGFIEKPAPCKSLVEPVNPFKVDREEIEGVTWGMMFGTLSVIAVISCGVLFLYKRSITGHIHTSLREEVMLEVQTQMETYKQLPS